MRRPKAIGILLAGLALFLPALADADKIYRWVDEAGQVHFTNTPPPGRRVQVLEGKPLEPVTTKEQELEARAAAVDGKRIWQEKCAGCHHLGEGRIEGRIGLARVVLDRTTLTPKPLQEVISRVQYAVEGSTTDMDPVDLSEAEVRAVARFIREQFE